MAVISVGLVVFAVKALGVNLVPNLVHGYALAGESFCSHFLAVCGLIESGCVARGATVIADRITLLIAIALGAVLGSSRNSPTALTRQLRVMGATPRLATTLGSYGSWAVLRDLRLHFFLTKGGVLVCYSIFACFFVVIILPQSCRLGVLKVYRQEKCLYEYLTDLISRSFTLMGE